MELYETYETRRSRVKNRFKDGMEKGRKGKKIEIDEDKVVGAEGMVEGGCVG